MATGIIIAVNPLAQIQKAQDARRKSDLSQIQKAVETYYQDVGKYPPSTSDYKIKGLNNNAIEWGSSWQPYMAVLPKDPVSTKTYVYYSSSNGQTYYLYASLDRGANDPQACIGGWCKSLPNSDGVQIDACGPIDADPCDYGVSSPNVSP